MPLIGFAKRNKCFQIGEMHIACAGDILLVLAAQGEMKGLSLPVDADRLSSISLSLSREQLTWIRLYRERSISNLHSPYWEETRPQTAKRHARGCWAAIFEARLCCVGVLRRWTFQQPAVLLVWSNHSLLTAADALSRVVPMASSVESLHKMNPALWDIASVLKWRLACVALCSPMS